MSNVHGMPTSLPLPASMYSNYRHIKYCQEGYGPHESMEMRESRLRNNAPTASYWLTVRDYLMINCRLIRGQRVGNGPLTLNALKDLCLWLFGPLGIQIMHAGCQYSWRTWQTCRIPIQQSTRRSWRGSLWSNVEIKFFPLWPLIRARNTVSSFWRRTVVQRACMPSRRRRR